MKKIILSALALILSLGVVTAQSLGSKNNTESSKRKQSYARALDLMGASLATLDRYFVDSIDIDKISRQGIESMLQSLDPYTEYYSKQDQDKLRLITTGEYGGIGAIISQRPDSTVIINDPMEGMPAAVAGLKAGDIILEIDGKSYRPSTSEKVSAALKGAPGSKISVLIERKGHPKPLRIEFVRRKIVVNPVSYAGIAPNGYGYIALSNFPNSAEREVRTALEGLLKQGIPGLILDLRGNGGGLLDEAIKIVNLFVPEGRVVVTTKARPELKQDVVYRTKVKPLAEQLPLVVLINSESASSAEIVAGALQDMDRAVVIGRKSFGKGLVQSTMQLPHEGILKLTTAKYYIPSGRCIQRIDYERSRRGGQAQATPDSLAKIFYTQAGRPVRDAGGIMPDLEVKADSLPTMLYYLNYNNDVYDWVTDYTLRHKRIASPTAFKLSEDEFASFARMLEIKKFDYDRQSAKALEHLKAIAEIEGYMGKAGGLIDSLTQVLKPDLKHDLEHLRPQIVDLLEGMIVHRYYYRRGAIERELLTDKVVAEAVRILSDRTRYTAMLASPNAKP